MQMEEQQQINAENLEQNIENLVLDQTHPFLQQVSSEAYSNINLKLDMIEFISTEAPGQNPPIQFTYQDLIQYPNTLESHFKNIIYVKIVHSHQLDEKVWKLGYKFIENLDYIEKMHINYTINKESEFEVKIPISPNIRAIYYNLNIQEKEQESMVQKIHGLKYFFQNLHKFKNLHELHLVCLSYQTNQHIQTKTNDIKFLQLEEKIKFPKNLQILALKVKNLQFILDSFFVNSDLQTLKNLNFLEIVPNNFREKFSDKVLDSLIQLNNTTPNLFQLNFVFNQSHYKQNTLEKFGTYIQSCKNLKFLDLSFKHDYQTNLEMQKISKEKGINVPIFQNLAQLAPTLENLSLYFHCYDYKLENYADLVNSVKQLNNLLLLDIRLEDDIRNPRELSIARQFFGKIFSDDMNENFPKLEIFNFLISAKYTQKKVYSIIQNEKYQQLFDALSKCKRLHTITFSAKFEYFDEKILANYISNGLKFNQYLGLSLRKSIENEFISMKSLPKIERGFNRSRVQFLESLIDNAIFFKNIEFHSQDINTNSIVRAQHIKEICLRKQRLFLMNKTLSLFTKNNKHGKSINRSVLQHFQV